MYEQNMTQIKRLQEGSIDYQYYAQRGRRRRNRLLRAWLHNLVALARVRRVDRENPRRMGEVAAHRRFGVAGFAATCR